MAPPLIFPRPAPSESEGRAPSERPGLAAIATLLEKLTEGAAQNPRAAGSSLIPFLGIPELGRTVRRLADRKPLFSGPSSIVPPQEGNPHGWGSQELPHPAVDSFLGALAVAPLVGPAARLTSKLPAPGPGTLHAGFPVPESWLGKYKIDTGGRAPEDLPLIQQVSGLDRYRVIPHDALSLANRLAPMRAGANSHVGDVYPELRDTPLANVPFRVLAMGAGTRGSFSPTAGVKISPNSGSAIKKAEVAAHEVTHGAQDASQMLGIGSNPDYFGKAGLRTDMDVALNEVLRVNPDLAKNELIPFRNQSVASPFSAYEGNAGEIVARTAGALTQLPGKLPPQVVVDSLVRTERAKSTGRSNILVQNDFGTFPVPSELFARGELKFYPDILTGGGSIVDKQGNLLGRVPNSASGYSQEAKLSRAPRFTFKDPKLVVTRGSRDVDPRQNELMAPSWAITRDNLLTRFGDTYVVPNLDRLEPRVSPTTIRNRDFFTPRASAYPKAVTGPEPGEYITTPLQRRADARLQARFGETFSNKGVFREGFKASLNPSFSNQKFVSLTDPAPRFVTRQNSGLDTSDWLRVLRELNPRFQSWKMFEEHPQGARLLRPPDSTAHKDIIAQLENSGVAPREVLRRLQLGESTPADIRKLEQLRAVTSNYGEAKTWGPWPLNSDTTRGVLIPDSRDLDLTNPKLRALRRAGVPLIQYDTRDAPAAFQLANELQRGKHFMPVAPLKGAPSASNPSQASLANPDLPPKQALKLFDVLKAQEEAPAVSDTLLKELEELEALMPGFIKDTKPVPATPPSLMEMFQKAPAFKWDAPNTSVMTDLVQAAQSGSMLTFAKTLGKYGYDLKTGLDALKSAKPATLQWSKAGVAPGGAAIVNSVLKQDWALLPAQELKVLDKLISAQHGSVVDNFVALTDAFGGDQKTALSFLDDLITAGYFKSN